MTQLWTPWRSQYVQEKKDKTACVFCDAAARTDDAETLVIFRGRHSFVILNRYPYTTGHVMIAPYQHASRLSQTAIETTDEMMRLARQAEVILEEVYRPHGLNLGMNLGEAAGAGIEQHIHLHVLPRWTGDANFMTSVANTRVMPETLSDTYRKLLGRFHE